MSRKSKAPDPVQDTHGSPPPELPRGSPAQGPGWAFAAVILGFIALAVAGVAMHDGRVDESLRDPIAGADRHELELVVRAVSVIIQTPSSAPQDPPVRALEDLHPQSAGAADLHDACVSTYRGFIELEGLRDELQRLIPLDAGTTPSPESQSRAAQLLERSSQLLRVVNQTRGRCTTLYESAAQRLGVRPARRP